MPWPMMHGPVMPALSRLLLICALMLPGVAAAHPGHSDRTPSTNRDDQEGGGTRVLPAFIDAFEIVRFTRSQHRALHHRIKNNIGKTRIEGMSDALALKATAAGEVAAREVGQLFFRMWRAKTQDDRSAVLAEAAAKLTATQTAAQTTPPQTQAERRAHNRTLRISVLMLDLVTAWQSNPMDGLR